MEIPQHVEKTLGIYQSEDVDISVSEMNTYFYQLIPSLNACSNPLEIKNLNKKLVRFECMIQDMYDEEFFIQVLKPHEGTSQSDLLDHSLFYKYYTELSQEQMQYYDTQHIDNQFASERGTVLGVSLPNVNTWLCNEEKPKQCLIKLYDDNIRAFKLNDVVTFIGIFEFNSEEENKVDEEGNSQMAAVEDHGDFRTGIPNESQLPHLHAISFRRNLSLNTNLVLPKAHANETLVKNAHEQLSETREKILSVLKMIIGGDLVSAEYLLMCLISKVHTRKDAFILGNLSLNLSNMGFMQGRYLTQFIKAITPFAMYLPLSIDTLESKKFSPKKNYDTNQLEPGLLQLVDGTFLIGDETVMKTG